LDGLGLVQVDLSALAKEVLAELKDAEPGRWVEADIEDGLVAEADLEVVRSVLQNVLASAFRFTSETADASIRFGPIEQGGVPVYLVADSGAGFTWRMPRGLLFARFTGCIATASFLAKASD
jgi:light-regulated signal transduction histidine kinase (bacteriophytochrome)